MSTQIAIFFGATGAIFVVCLLAHWIRKSSSSNRLGNVPTTQARFKRISSLPVPVTTPQTRQGPSSSPAVPSVTRAPVIRIDSDPSLPAYTARDLAPPAPVYNPTSPPGRVSPLSLTPNSCAALPVTYPVSEPPAVTPYVPTPPGSLRPPSYRSGNSQSSMVRAVLEAGADSARGVPGPSPPQYEVAVARRTQF